MIEVDFTREPIIESVITPKEGCKLVIRSSKGAGQEEFFVDAVEVVSFGNTFFLRSLEKPKAFLVPATDYEILEVRETRMVLKNVGLDRSIKIGGGREGSKRPSKVASKPEIPEPQPEQKPEPKRRERRRQYRKRKGKDVLISKEQEQQESENEVKERVRIPTPETITKLKDEGIGRPITSSSSVLSSLLPPPSTLISESIERYKGNELFKDVFIPKEQSLEPQSSDELEEEIPVEPEIYQEEIMVPDEPEEESNVDVSATDQEEQLENIEESEYDVAQSNVEEPLQDAPEQEQEEVEEKQEN